MDNKMLPCQKIKSCYPCGGKIKVLREFESKTGGKKRLTKCTKCGNVKMFMLPKNDLYLGWPWGK